MLYPAALLGVAAISAGVTAYLRPRVEVVTVAVRPSATSPPQPAALFRVALRAPAPVGRDPVRHRTAQHPRSTPSLYERTTSPVVLREQGCRAGSARTSGIVILDFGKPAYADGAYGTITFSNRFASNTAITRALKSYARGYGACLPKRARARITLVRGTSNYRLWTLPSGVTAGRYWAGETVAFAAYLKHHGLDGHVTAAAGDDAEPAWDRTFQRTYNFFRGFRSAGSGYLLYNYGSLDGGPGTIWTVQQAYYVAAGMRYARAVPEIYNRRMAQQWALLSRLAAERYGRGVSFAGVMTQHSQHCASGCYTPAQAHRALVRELSKSPKTRVQARTLASATNIATPAPVRANRAR